MIEGVSSQPKAPGVYSVLKSPEKWSRYPREPLYGLPKTPWKTVPSGATIGLAVLSSIRPAPWPLAGSSSCTEDTGAIVVVLNPTR